MNDHRQRLIDAYLKAPELLQLELALIFAQCRDDEVPVHNHAVERVGQLVEGGLGDMLQRVADIILEVAQNEMKKENK